MTQDQAKASVWRCRICGDSYLGAEIPSNCPFCGSRTHYLSQTADYSPDMNTVDLTDSERADLEYACELEITNKTFYDACGALGRHNDALPSAFRALSKVEHEHLSIFGKLLRTEVPQAPKNPLPVSEDWAVNIAQSKKDEETASSFYIEAAARATNPRVKDVFTALAEVEADHIDIDAFMKGLAA